MDLTQYDAVDLGCGTNKHDGALGIDIVDTSDADLVMDLSEFPWELPSDSFSMVYCMDILEHVSEPLQFLEEVYRIAEDGANIRIKTPHFTNPNTWADPTHKRPFSARMFSDYITAEGQYSYYTDAVFELEEIYINFESARKYPWNVIGRYVANKWPEHYEKTVLRSLFPAQSMFVTLRVVK